MSVEKNLQSAKLDRSGINRIIVVLVTLIAFGILLFVSAGRLNWGEAWIFLALYLAGILLNGIWMFRHNPDVINERGRIGPNAKAWDKVIGVFYMLFLLGIYIIAGLDARFAWSGAPLWVEILGGLGFAISLGLTFWVITVNTFLSTFVRIQDDRGQTPITSGPYSIVRHPMYAASLFMCWGIPLLLGSWWALLPGLLLIVVFCVRTALEDQTLQAELPGYKDYVQKVHYRLIPGIW